MNSLNQRKEKPQVPCTDCFSTCLLVSASEPIQKCVPAYICLEGLLSHQKGEKKVPCKSQCTPKLVWSWSASNQPLYGSIKKATDHSG